jgi:hypothetical protein
MNRTYKRSFFSSMKYSIMMFVYDHACKLSISLLWIALFIALTSENTYVVTTAITLSLPIAMYFLMNFKKHCISDCYLHLSWEDIRPDDITPEIVQRYCHTACHPVNVNDVTKSSCCGGTHADEDKIRNALYKGEG